MVTKPCVPRDLEAEVRRQLAARHRADLTRLRRSTARHAQSQGPTGKKSRSPQDGDEESRACETRRRRRLPGQGRGAPAAEASRPPVRHPRSAGRRRPAASAEPSGAGPADRAASTSTASSRRPSPCASARIGIGSEPADVHTVNYKDIAAVVSDTPLEVYDPTRENVLAHERVNEAVMRELHGDPHVLQHGVQDPRGHRRAAAHGLRRLPRRAHQDAGQAGVRPQGAVGARDSSSARSRRTTRTCASCARRSRTRTARPTSPACSTAGWSTPLLAGALRDSSWREIFAALGAVSVASRANKPIGDKMILNAAFLVARDREPDFDAKVKEIDARVREPDVQVHRPLAALQLRQHPAEAGARDRS